MKVKPHCEEPLTPQSFDLSGQNQDELIREDHPFQLKYIRALLMDHPIVYDRDYHCTY